MFLTLVLHAGVSLRGTAKVLATISLHLRLGLRCPDWSTGRTWLLTLGYYKLTCAKEQADDWVWMIDHTCQVGKHKCLLILGARLSELPNAGEYLRLQDLQPLEILPVTTSNKVVVAKQLEQLSDKLGAPRLILRDEGADLRGGVETFVQKHPETLDFYDVKHKAACVLRKTLEADERWSDFCRDLASAKRQMNQTELAFLAPPAHRVKARYMNVDVYVRWGSKTLALLQNPPQVVQELDSERVEAKLGWLREYEDDLAKWSDVMDVIGLVEEFVRSEGIYSDCVEALEEVLPECAANSPAAVVREEMVEHVRGQAQQARVGERLPGSTEILESCFGKFKHLEKDQSYSGVTGLLLSLGALVGKTTQQLVETAMKKCPLKCVWRWCKEKLGESVQGKRRKAYNNAPQIPDED